MPPSPSPWQGLTVQAKNYKSLVAKMCGMRTLCVKAWQYTGAAFISPI